MIAWVLTVTLADPPKTIEPQAVIPSFWTTEKDCRQAEKLELRIAKLEGHEQIIKCEQVEMLDQVTFEPLSNE